MTPALPRKRLSPRTRFFLGAAAFLTLAAAYPVYDFVQNVQARAARIEKAKAQNAADEAEFNRLCKDVAGYKIHKVVEDVEGIQLLKVRHDVKDGDMYAPDAAFALERIDDGYISSFLAYRYPPKPADQSYDVSVGSGPDAIPGFKYVDVLDEQDGRRYRYTGRWEEPWQYDKNYLKGYIKFFLDRVPAPDPAPRYAVTFENPVIPEERAKGLASSTVKVIDTQTNEVIAEMTRYARGPRKPSSYNPNPWLVAYKCPGVATGASAATRQFVDRVLVAKGATRPPMPDFPPKN